MITKEHLKTIGFDIDDISGYKYSFVNQKEFNDHILKMFNETFKVSQHQLLNDTLAISIGSDQFKYTLPVSRFEDGILIYNKPWADIKKENWPKDKQIFILPPMLDIPDGSYKPIGTQWSVCLWDMSHPSEYLHTKGLFWNIKDAATFAKALYGIGR